MAFGAVTFAAEAKPTAGASASDVAATVNGEPIFMAEVRLGEGLLSKNRQPKIKGPSHAQAEVLKQIISRRLAAIALKRDDAYVTQEEIEKGLKKLAQNTAANQQLTVEQFAAKRGVTASVLEHEVAWSIGWEKYLGRNLADALETYFNEHHKDFDGTQLRVSHILLRPDRYNETSLYLADEAAKIREDILAGKLTFEQAAEKYSAGPSRKTGGDLGFIPRHGVMIDDFTNTAFALEKGQISKPVTTAFGVHLIRVTDVKPGTRQWTQASDEMKNPASMHLFEKLADQERKQASIVFTGKCAYFKPGTDEVVPAVETK